MNKLSILILLFGFLSVRLFGQITVDVAENTFKVGGLGGEEIFYYGFAEGDQLVFNFQEVNGKELKELEIIELPSSSKFMDYKTIKIENKILNIPRTGIYKFRFINSAVSGRICKIKIQRIPASDATKNFNTSIYWKTIQDTTYTPKTERFLVKSDTIAQEIYSSSPQISSTNALNENKNYQVVDFVLPDNTISWSFYIGTGSEGKTEYDNARNNFTQSAAELVSKIPGYGPLAELALTGVSYFNKVQGNDNVKYWFLSDENTVSYFNMGLQSNPNNYKKGDVVNEASQMKSPLKGKIYLALLNDNTIDPIIVTIKITAIQVIQQWDTRTINITKVISRDVPYLSK